MRKLRLHMLIAVICAVSSNFSVADELAYDIRVGASYTDNVRRADTMLQEETVAFIGIQLDASHTSRRVDAGIQSDWEYRDYVDNSFDADDVGSVNAHVSFQISPDIFSWVATNYYGTLQSNPFLADTPDNRENINVFSTGPDLKLRLGSRSAFHINGRYTNRYFEVSDINNDVLSGGISLVRTLSPNRSLSLNVSADRLEFDDSTVNSDFDLQSAYVSVSSQNSRGTAVVNLGVNELHDSGMVSRGTLIGLNWSRKLTAKSSFSLDYYQRFSDAGDIFRRFQDPGRGFGNVRSIPGVGDAFESRRFSANINIDQEDYEFYFSVIRDEQVYETSSALNRDMTGLGLGASKTLGSAWRVNFDARFGKTEFDASGRTDDDIEMRARISRQLSRRFSVNFSYRRSERKSNSAGFDYTENVASLSIGYGR